MDRAAFLHPLMNVKITTNLHTIRPRYVLMYRNAMMDERLVKEQMRHKMKTIRSQRHQLGSYEINKISLSWSDDKRYIQDDGVTSYAYGHEKIND